MSLGGQNAAAIGPCSAGSRGTMAEPEPNGKRWVIALECPDGWGGSLVDGEANSGVKQTRSQIDHFHGIKMYKDV